MRSLCTAFYSGCIIWYKLSISSPTPDIIFDLILVNMKDVRWLLTVVVILFALHWYLVMLNIFSYTCWSLVCHNMISLKCFYLHTFSILLPLIRTKVTLFLFPLPPMFSKVFYINYLSPLNIHVLFLSLCYRHLHFFSSANNIPLTKRTRSYFLYFFFTMNLLKKVGCLIASISLLSSTLQIYSF